MLVRNQFVLALIMLFYSFNAVSQDIYMKIDVAGSTTKKLSNDFNKGERFKSLIFLEKAGGSKSSYFKSIILLKDNGEEVEFDYSKKITEDLIFDSSTDNYWKCKAITENVYSYIMDNGIHPDIRNSLDIESNDYLNYLETNNYFIEDDAVREYLQSIILKIYPLPQNDGRIGQLDFRLLKNNEPLFIILPNGSALISIGLLNLVNSDEELMAIMAHELAHFVLDHPIYNINLEVKREKREQFWSGFANFALASTTGYVFEEVEKYTNPYDFSISTLYAPVITTEIKERIGLVFSPEQVLKADDCALELLALLGINKDALASVLIKMREYYYYTGNYKIFSDFDFPVNITERIERIGVPKTRYSSKEYDQKISAVITIGAFYEYHHGHFQTSEKLLWRNINSGSATEEDYILMALVNLMQYTSESKYKESLTHLTTAKSLGISPDDKVYKVESLIYLRINDFDSAMKSLKKYQSAVENHLNSIDTSLLSNDSWNNLNNHLNEELVWTKKMIYKIGK